MYGKLDVGTACFHTDLPHNGDGRISHQLIFTIREGLCRGHCDAVTGMDSHGVEILNGTDNDHIIVEVPHDLQFILLPS